MSVPFFYSNTQRRDSCRPVLQEEQDQIVEVGRPQSPQPGQGWPIQYE
jgi:hypothetical protein